MHVLFISLIYLHYFFSLLKQILKFASCRYWIHQLQKESPSLSWKCFITDKHVDINMSARIFVILSLYVPVLLVHASNLIICLNIGKKYRYIILQQRIWQNLIHYWKAYVFLFLIFRFKCYSKRNLTCDFSYNTCS